MKKNNGDFEFCCNRRTVCCDSRPSKKGRRRRHRCTKCDNRWTTYERDQFSEQALKQKENGNHAAVRAVLIYALQLLDGKRPTSRKTKLPKATHPLR